jgi:hypothetical protein
VAWLFDEAQCDLGEEVQWVGDVRIEEVELEGSSPEIRAQIGLEEIGGRKAGPGR